MPLIFNPDEEIIDDGNEPTGVCLPVSLYHFFFLFASCIPFMEIVLCIMQSFVFNC